MNTLVIDIGGSNVKIWRTGESEKIKFESGPKMTPEEFVKTVKKHIDEWKYDRVSIGYPGDVLHGYPTQDPYNLAPGWVGFDFAKAFKAPLKIMNDACMQAFGSYEGGRMLFLGLGTSMGSVYMIDGKIIPLALGHLKLYKDETLESHLNHQAYETHGGKKWQQAVTDAIAMLKPAFLADYVVLGGGQAKKLSKLPEGCRRGSNEMAYIGGVRMWEPDANHPPGDDRSKAVEAEPKKELANSNHSTQR
ncbi:MAG TPA: ROK family protein [Pirellulales bacterium]|jgi:predicted NBD/HSP70 family sugar kinase|nr:ROK family protein [Pirellulales bacterium]